MTENTTQVPQKVKRKRLRLKHFDYTSVGAYYVTICTQDRRCLFGDVINGAVELNDVGRIVETIWKQLPTRYPTIELDQFIVMPNHIHAIILIVGAGSPRPTDHSHPIALSSRGAETAPLRPCTLGQIVAYFKYGSTKQVNLKKKPGTRLWQRNYYEHVIRNENDLNEIREYIEHNPFKWDEDPENVNRVTVLT